MKYWFCMPRTFLENLWNTNITNFFLENLSDGGVERYWDAKKSMFNMFHKSLLEDNNFFKTFVNISIIILI